MPMKNDEALKDILALSAEPTEGQMSIDDFLPKPKRGNVPVVLTDEQIMELREIYAQISRSSRRATHTPCFALQTPPKKKGASSQRSAI